MPISESCFMMATALHRITMGADIAAWAANKKRFDEASDFLSAVSRDISLGLAAGYITNEDAELMRSSLKRYFEAVERGDAEAMQDSLATISAKSLDITYQKVIECETRKR